MKTLNRAIEAIGTQTALAEFLGLNPMAVTQWKKRGVVPPKYYPAIESATGGVVTCEEMLKEFYSNEEAAA